MARTAAYRKYQLTINNPEKHNINHEVLKATLSSFPGLEYWCMSDEIGREGETPHTHVYFAAKNAIAFSTVQQRFYGAHIEAAKGSHRQNRDYILKEGKWSTSEKQETSVPGTFEESGELPPDRDKRQSQSSEVLAMVEAGADDADIILAYPSWMRSIKSIGATRQALLEKEYRTVWRDLDTHYLHGETGVGKTRFVMEKYGYEKVYRVTNYAHPFDGYQGQEVILFDEFRSDLPLKDMLKYLDGYPLMLPCRYGDKVACYTTVYIISNIPLDSQYPNVQREEPKSWEAFLRRISDTTEVLPPKSEDPDWVF